MHIHAVGSVRAGDREEMWEEISTGGVAKQMWATPLLPRVTSERGGEADGGCSRPRNTEFPQRINSFL